MVFNVLPTLLEIGLVAGLLWYLLDWRFSAITLLVITGYIFFTFKVTAWRIGLRRGARLIFSLQAGPGRAR